MNNLYKEMVRKPGDLCFEVSLESDKGLTMTDLSFALKFFVYGHPKNVCIHKDDLKVVEGKCYAVLNEHGFVNGVLFCEAEIVETINGINRIVSVRSNTGYMIGNCCQTSVDTSSCDHGYSLSLYKVEYVPQPIDPNPEEDQLIAEELFGEKLSLPELTADRAIADEHGNRIADTYETRQAVRNHIREVYNEQFNENPPLIMDGYITPQMLSESTKQLLENTGQAITNVPDGEDLTTKQGVLKLSDKPYNPGAYSGLGRVYLRKNLVGGQNLLTQSMVSKPNTIYILQYDYTLDGKSITIPEGCVLSYEGGSIRDGHINYNDTLIHGTDHISNVTTNGATRHAALPTDEEDITGANGKNLKFKDKEYAPQDYSGLGRIYLRKNIKTVYSEAAQSNVTINLLEQSMIDKPNTIYIIQYDYSLNGAEITIPEGCVLQFEGGSLSNGTIEGNNTAIQSSPRQIFGLDVELKNIWDIDKINVKWFGAKGDKINDDTRCIQKAASFKFPLYIPIGEYLISDTCQIYNDICCYGEFIFIKTEFDAPIIELMPHEYPKHSIARGILINISNYEYGTSNYGGYGIVIHNCWTLENCDVTSCKYGIVAKSWVINIQNCNAKYNEINLIVTGGNKGEQEECNNVYVTGGSFDSPRSEFSALIGESPLSGYGDWDEDGKNIRIEECAFDGGTVQISRVVSVCVTSCYFENVQNGSALTLYDKNSYGANYIFVSNHFNKCRYGLTCYKERLSGVSATYRTPGVVFTDNFMLKITHSFVYIPSPCVKLVAKRNINILEDKTGDISNPFCKYYIGLPWDSPSSIWNYSNLYLDILDIDDYDGRYKQKEKVNIGNTYSYVSSPCFTRTKAKKSSGTYDSSKGQISLSHKSDIVGFYPGDYITWNKEQGPSGSVTNAYIRSIDYDKGIILVSVDNSDIQPSTIEFQTVSTAFKTIVEVAPFGGNVVGQFMFNEELNKPIWWTGSKWVDATGAEV